MAGKNFIQVILPLRLEWEPFYAIEGETSIGTRVRVDFAGREYVAVVSATDASPQKAGIDPSRIKTVKETASELEPVTEEEIRFWRMISDYYLCTTGEVYKAAYPALRVEKEETLAKARAAALARSEKELLKRKEKEEQLLKRIEARKESLSKARKAETRSKYEEEIARLEASLKALTDRGQEPAEDKAGGLEVSGKEITLSPEQTQAYSEIKKGFSLRRPVLLHGVTGSGKTEIYLRLAQETIAQGRNVLYLVPEIALSRQLEERLLSVFPNRLRVFHSAETMSRRRETADFLRKNGYIVLGTRSAVLLPHRNLGLVIVDEEHDSSYKQTSPAPRYNGRESAIMLAGIFSADVLLGSATPSLESVFNCSVRRYTKVSLTKRYYDAENADVKIIDTIAERRKHGMSGNFSFKLIEHIRRRLERHEQIIILRERRAYSPIVQCRECGDIPKCSRCNVTLSLHRRSDGAQRLVCHYCGRTYEYSGRCGKCGGEYAPLGSGTQKIEEEARLLFPQARIERLDSDAARHRQEEKDIIARFSRGETDILIGTQMVTKGFDFGGVRLVAVLQADSILGQEDYRADERGLQLLEQFRGRSGRRGEKGLFVIQTSRPEHPVYKAINGSIGADELNSRLLAERKAFGYPPYSRTIVAIISDYSQPRAEYMALELTKALQNAGFPPSVMIIGPYSPAVDKVSGQHVRKVRILLPKDRTLSSCKNILAQTVGAFEKTRKYTGHIALDVDPV